MYGWRRHYGYAVPVNVKYVTLLVTTATMIAMRCDTIRYGTVRYERTEPNRTHDQDQFRTFNVRIRSAARTHARIPSSV